MHLPVTVIGGYLGAGKTTLVNRMLRHAGGARLAILVNEFGALPIDEDLIEAQDDTLISIAGGCVCCSFGSDLIAALGDMARLDPPPDHVVIEASGVALPGGIAGSVSIMSDHRLDGIVVLADAETVMAQGADPYMGDTITRQLADADIVLLNKVDLISEVQAGEVAQWLAQKAPRAALVETRHCDVPNAVVLQGFERGSSVQGTKAEHMTSGFETATFTPARAKSAEAVARALASEALGLIRAKGFVETADGMHTVQIVGRRWDVTDAPRGAEPGLVAIAAAGALEGKKVETALFGL